ncbi:enoyl-CoA hydratase/isomerase family protein [Cryobacterium sp. 10C3]|uniref:enoyl-CoA hydratase/isomerase family protein n=1 Tax=Cryobacterium sp. 10C3 TaxID=3048577 RepID=UPI002AB3438D|nr:enoyl-CoA hydratase/isomerase family protein [Cryobacterium sp. 10C3]MDY7557599.1 enoyl-CoA hydratase/isomerase family protein [Cryobacterium sp. 10C3]
MNRPEVRNAIDQHMVDELHELCAGLELHPQILILTGCDTDKGAIFASGADISQLRERRSADALRGINSTIFRRIAALPMPVIAAIDGFALGGGAELAFAADFRIGTPRLRIGNPETGLGIMAAAGATWRLIELVGEPVAKEILLAGRVLSADEALALHLVTEIHEPDLLIDAAIALASRISTQDPLAVQLTKKVMHAPRESHPLVEELAQAILFESPEKFARMDAFLDAKKRK